MAVIFAALFLAMAGCGPDPFFIPVASINGVPETGTAGEPLILTGMVSPGFASNNFIIWLVRDAGTTGAVINGNILDTQADGTVVIRAVIINGIAEGANYSQDFSINIGGGGAAGVISITSAAIYLYAPAKDEIPCTDADSGAESVHYTIGSVSWSPADNPFKGGIVYTATVTLTANEGYTFKGLTKANINGKDANISGNKGTTVILSHTFAKTLDKDITGLEIKTQPTKMTYTHNEKLELSGLVVTLTFDDSTTTDVPYSNFDTYNLSAEPDDGDKLNRSIHKFVVVSVGNFSKNTGNLTINKAIISEIIFPTASAITYGAALSTSTLTGGSTSYGAFKWYEPATIPTVINDGYYMEFIPNDTDNYDYTGISDFDHYTKTIMRTVSIPVNKAPGSAVTVPTVNGSPTSNSITVNAVSLVKATGQSIEYAILEVNNGNPSTWQSGATFDGLKADTTYYVYARSVSNDNYNAGTHSVSAGIATAGGPVTSSIDIEMVPIPAGTFMMGSPASEPNRGSDETQHSVTLSAFSMSKYQVTQGQYQAVMGSNPSDFKTAVSGESGTPGKLPVECVSWYDALVFCNKLSIAEGLTPAYSISGKTNPADWGAVPTNSNATWNAVVIVAGSTGYRLPTEAQWEYACRAGTTTAYNTGDTISDNTGWYTSNSGSKTHEVGKKPANAWGLYDMHGNVWEWCWDWNGDYSSSAQTDPMGASSGTDRVDRGGSWGYSAGDLRSAFRICDYPSGRYNNLGFRLVRP